MKTIRLWTRMLFSVIYTARIVAEIGLKNLLFGPDLKRSMRIRRRWARKLLAFTGWRLEIEGPIPDYPCLIFCNHRTFIDPILFLRDIDAFPVAKAELASWPVIGKGAQMAGILYVDRAHSGSRAGILRQMKEKVEQGFPVLVFPEGTTSDQNKTLPFKTGGFRLAAQNQIPVVPAVLLFQDKNDFWVGSDSLFRHLVKRGGEKALAVKLIYGRRLLQTDATLLAEEVKSWIDAHLSPQRPSV